jgi:ABC-type Fe3+ transport system substrate-binding protein
MQDINDALIRKHYKEGASVVTYFWVPTKQNKRWKSENTKNISKTYSKEIQKIIGARKRCWNIEKMIKLVENVQKCKILKFDSIFLTDESPVDKQNSSWERKV